MEPERFYNTASIKRIFLPTRTFSGPKAREFVPELIAAFESYVIIVDQTQQHDEFVSRMCACPRHVFKSPVVVSAEPTSASVNTFLGRLCSRTVEAVVAVGGGSTIDTAKAVIASIAYGTWQIKDPTPATSMPSLVAIPTTAGSGSEVSRYYVITDASTKEKRSYRSWSIAPRYAVYDPYFLRAAPLRLLVLGAFDAFTHLWETFVCRYERSWFTDTLALDGIGRIFHSLDLLDAGGDRSDVLLSELQYAAMLGGMALSNVRTGLLHDAGEALAAQVPLSHPETLVVFFRATLEQYRSAITDREDLLRARIGTDVNSVLARWDTLFSRLGIYDDTSRVLRGAAIDRRRIAQKINTDRVLVEKESPIPLSPEAVEQLLDVALEGF